jgi:GT2 family glycosyltransferase
MRTETSTFPQRASELTPEAARVSVVIVIWNAKKYVLECLESLREHCKNIYTEVIVVDNRSTDGSPEMVANLFPEFTLIRNPENYGFAKANNIGISASSGEYVCLVNSDVKFVDDCISPLLGYLGANPGVAMVGPKMLLAATGAVARSTMRFPTPWNYFCRALGLDVVFKRSRLFGGFMMSDFNHQTTRPVEVLNCWFVVARRRAIQDVGPLDPQFFMYGEDIDWCYRFRQAGEQIVFFADAGAIHYGGASSSNAPIRFYLEMCRADWQLWRKHRGRLGGATFLVIVGIHSSVRLFLSAFRYVCLPSHRPNTLLKLRRNLAILGWLAAGKDRTVTYGTSPAVDRESPAA